jgi:endonuclease/exonuclease/phosphatase family metal-dependent hydrolase
VEFPSGDVTAVQLNGDKGKILLFNVYNDCDVNDTIQKLEAFNQATNCQTSSADANINNSETTIWLGDFNRHHPHWDDPNDTRLFTRSVLDNAEILISTVAGAGLELALPPGIPTHLHNDTKCWTRLDQVFILEEALEMVISCEALEDTPVINTDHLPILVLLWLELLVFSDC